jgi:glyceraldehyde 3-phosphate dehydrogenase
MNIGMNGFGRFGLHLLKYWLDRSLESSFFISYINDDTITIEDAYNFIIHDKSVVFNKYKVSKLENKLMFSEPNGTVHTIIYTNFTKENIPWLGEPSMVFECSGKNTLKKDSLFFIQGNTTKVIISATSWDADTTLVYGFNHKDYNFTDPIISYGSCTVNAYTPLANYIHKKYGIIDSDVNVIHNVQEYRLCENDTLIRKFCTLEKSGQNLLNFINNNNFVVNYTIVPYTGVSMIDFRFRVQRVPDVDLFISDLSESISGGYLKDLYGISQIDIGPEQYNCTTYSSVFIKENIKISNGNIYLPSYFDNENSVNRYYDLSNFIAKNG